MTDQTETNEASPQQVLFRRYPHGEVCAVMPDQSGSPDGTRCVGFVLNLPPYSVDMETVLTLTVPAEKMEYARLKRMLEKEPYGYTLIVLQSVAELAEGTHESRQERGIEYLHHGHIRRLFPSQTSSLTPVTQ